MAATLPPNAPSAIAALPRFAAARRSVAAASRCSGSRAALGGGAEVWIKREDLLPLAFGGNKLRNLEFLVGAALADGADTLVTSGRRWSNHCRLTAAAGARAGLAVHLVLTGPPPTPPRAEPAPRRAARRHASTSRPTDDRAERAALVERVAADLRAAGRRPFVIGVGGTGPIGRPARCSPGSSWLDSRRRRASAGDGRAALGDRRDAGRRPGRARLARADAAVVGIAVAAPAAELSADDPRAPRRPRAARGRRRARPRDRCSTTTSSATATADRRAAADEATELLARTEGILVDPIYTAKALAGLVARVRDGRLTGPVVFWHAGGTPALFEPLADRPAAGRRPSAARPRRPPRVAELDPAPVWSTAPE